MKKLIIAWVLTVCLAFALAGCGKKTDEPEQPASETEAESGTEDEEEAETQEPQTTVVEIGEDEEGEVAPD